MSTPNRLAVWLARSWWLVMPPFAALVARLTYERTCAAPYELLPTLTRLPLFAWMLAGLYVAAHAWVAAAYLLTVASTGALIPPPARIRELWRGRLTLVILATVLLAVEYAPVTMWRAVGHSLSCRAGTETSER
jgi:hypothetical protein